MTTLNTNTLSSIQLSQVIEQLEQLLFCDLVMTYNDYASANYYELIHDNDEENINTLFDTPYDTAKAVVYGSYNPNDDYVMLDGYSNAVSFSYQLTQDEKCPIDIEELSQWIIDNELFNEYDIEVTTLDDMLASIEDNITDDEDMLLELSKLLSLKVKNVEKAMLVLSDYNYKQLIIVINHLGINYE